MELRDAIEFGDQESILAITDLIHKGAAQLKEIPFHRLQHGDLRDFARDCLGFPCGRGHQSWATTRDAKGALRHKFLRTWSICACFWGSIAFVPRVHSQSPGVQGARGASFVHQSSATRSSRSRLRMHRAKNPGLYRRRRRRVRSEVINSDEDAPFVVPGPSRRLVLVPESAGVTPQSIQDRERDTRLESGAQFSMMDQGDTLVSSDEEPLVPCSRNSSCARGPQCRPAQELSWTLELRRASSFKTWAPGVEERSGDIEPTQWESGADVSPHLSFRANASLTLPKGAILPYYTTTEVAGCVE